MARARNIKPGFFANENLAECDPLARLLFAGLWCLADRAGRLEDRPKRIRAELLPYDACDADVLLNQLQQHGFITRYEVGGTGFIQVLNFDKHQNPHMKEAKSTIPAPDGFGGSQVQEQVRPTGISDEHQASTVQAPGQHQASPADSGFSDSLIPRETREDSRSRSDRSKTLKTYLAECKEQGVKPIPDDHFIRSFMADAGIGDEMAQIAWLRFKDEHLNGSRKGKRYIDWPATFANSVKDRWYRLWTVPPEGEAQWTSEGHQARRAIEAASQQPTQESA